MCRDIDSGPKQRCNEKVKLMIDSGSQRTACGVQFAKNYETDDSERAKLWDIQGQQIEAHGKKVVDVLFHGQAHETPIFSGIKVDVSDVGRNVASMGRLVRVALHEFWSHLLDEKWLLENDDP